MARLVGVRAAYIEQLGGPELIRYGSLPDPTPGPTDVLVAVDAVAVNPVDTFVRSGGYPTPTPFPFVIGRDLVGRVVAGSGFSAGERVWCNSLGHDGRQGSFSSLATVPAERLYCLPSDLAATDAVAVLHPYATAFLGLFRAGKLTLGETVYVGGGAGNVGSAAIRMATAAGARVLASARPADFDDLRSAGAVDVFDYQDGGLHESLRGAGPVDLYWDTSGHHDLAGAAVALATGGRVVLSAARGAQPSLPVGALYTRNISLHGFVISRVSAADLGAAAKVVNQMFARGAAPARIAEVLPLADARRAHELLEGGRVRGRLVLVPAR